MDDFADHKDPSPRTWHTTYTVRYVRIWNDTEYVLDEDFGDPKTDVRELANAWDIEDATSYGYGVYQVVFSDNCEYAGGELERVTAHRHLPTQLTLEAV